MAQLKTILLLGSTGILGHVLCANLNHDSPLSFRCLARRLTGIRILDSNVSLVEDAYGSDNLRSYIDSMNSVVVVNCIGAKLTSNRDRDNVTNLNALLPQKIAGWLDAKNDGSRLIQISSDGVFDGKRGRYTEMDTPNATDLYGLSKIAGEIVWGDHLTIRTSFIGHSLSRCDGLLDWFLNSTEPVTGYSHAFWNGVTSLELAKFILQAIRSELSGLVHLEGERTTKYDLLKLFGKTYARQTSILASSENKSDRTLSSTRRDLNYTPADREDALLEYKKWYQLYIRPCL